MKKRNAVEVLGYLEKRLIVYLEELKECAATDRDRFAYGEKTAYVECLEIIQLWDASSLDSYTSVEERFPL